MNTKQIDKYWAKVDKSGSCWLWTAYKTKKGYGEVRFNNITYRAHRVSAYISGLIPSIKSVNGADQVLHTCDTPSCMNPDHFFIGSNADNMKDRDSKGRQVGGVSKGEANGQSKLTEKEVIDIRRFYAQGGISYRDLAKIYGVAHSQIACIVKRQTWAYL
jgi:hypothetical protein